MIKVLIVEDSRVVSEYLNYILSSDPEIQIVGNVSNGRQAIEFLKKKKPDVITMDIDMPIMDGLEATRIIMSTTPVPIIIVTASRNAKEVSISMEALAAGALSVEEKPRGIGHPDEEFQARKLIKIVKLMSEIKVVTRKFYMINKSESKLDVKISKHTIGDLNKKKIVVVGSSSGGPLVLQKIFSKITQEFPYPILVVQHIAVGFIDGLINWLRNTLLIPIQVATDNEVLKSGHIYFAPDHHQMGVSNSGKINLDKSDSYNGLCPSVAYLFKSVAEEYGKHAIGIILTGMGSDGANELKILKDAGSITIAQDKESSIVHGMPGVAIRLNAANYIMNPVEISDVLLNIEQYFTSINENLHENISKKGG
ncbi:MAG: chemotaxis-specific protein-glutamate methyltransferase CheB [Bacteroidales bacterium]|nr:chemotaxis-specific protein-glutamate methyltransferase CheB [Bacteroidales bacterium]